MSTDQHLNTGAMALGALPENEAGDFAGHLAECPTCSAELNGFLETAAILGNMTAQTPPASLRRSVMEAVAQTTQLPPLTGDTLQNREDAALGRHREAAAAAEEAIIAASATAGRAELAEGHLAPVLQLRRPWYRRPQAYLAAAAAAVVIAGGTTVALSNRSTPAPSASACIAAATDSHQLAPSVGKGGAVTLSASCNAATVTVPSLPDAPAGKVYQLWRMQGADATSVGVMQKNANGSYSSFTTQVHAGDTGIGVSIEPAAPRSDKPTSAPIWIVPLTA